MDDTLAAQPAALAAAAARYRRAAAALRDDADQLARCLCGLSGIPDGAVREEVSRASASFRTGFATMVGGQEEAGTALDDVAASLARMDGAAP